MLIRNKLTLLFTSLVLAIQLAFSAYVYTFYSAYRKQEFFGQLEAKARVFGRVLVERQDVAHLLSAHVPASDLITLTNEQISIYDEQGKLLYDNRNAEYDQQEQRLLPRLRGPAEHVRFAVGEVEGVGHQLAHNNRPYFVFVAGYDQLGRSKRDNLLLILLVGNLGTLVLILVSGWYFSGKFLRPLSVMTHTVRHISEAHLHTRLSEGNRRDEIAQLAMTFNQMLGQLERSFQSQQRFVSHASHELRTPLTNVLGTLDTSLTYDKNPADWRKSMQEAIGEIRKVIGLTNSLLSLAKVGTEPLEPIPVRLDECVLEAVEQIQRKYPNRTIHLAFGEVSDDYFLVNGNAALLTTAFVNVIDNACKYSEKPVQVLLQKAPDNPATYEIRVIDMGRGIAPQDRAHVFEPLVRGSNVGQVEGFGVGLAVTEQLISLHHGQISLLPTQPAVPDTPGTTVIVHLPAS